MTDIPKFWLGFWAIVVTLLLIVGLLINSNLSTTGLHIEKMASKGYHQVSTIYCAKQSYKLTWVKDTNTTKRY